MIDSHSHIGNDSFHPLEGNLKEYLSNASCLGIKSANIMPVPCPIYVSSSGKKIQSLIWEIRDSKIILEKRISDKYGNVKKIKNPKNPYKEYNSIIEKKIKKVKEIDLNFIPLIHPYLDTPKHLEEILDKFPKAIKIHGIAGGIVPKKISKDFWKRVYDSNVPLILHTDSGIPANDTLEYFCSRNKPLDWIKELKKYDVRAFLAHGARFCPKALQEVKNSSNFVLGIAPDLLLYPEKDRLSSPHKYLSNIIDIVGCEKVALDLDYPWNLFSMKSMSLEWGIVDRLKKFLSKKEFFQVTQKTPLDFFKI